VELLSSTADNKIGYMRMTNFTKDTADELDPRLRR
jgi:hypothetical protein